MKKILYIVLSALSVIFLTSCDPGSTSLEYHFEKEEVKTVELIHYDNHDQHHFRSWERFFHYCVLIMIWNQ